MNIPYGRYALALTWYKTLLNGDILTNTFVPETDEGVVDTKLLSVIRVKISEFLK
ncbi:hypothetical protein D3C75_1369360 [compost metagenome]